MANPFAAKSRIEPAGATLNPPLVVPHGNYRGVKLRLGDGPLLPFDCVDPKPGEQYRIIRGKLLHSPAGLRMVTVTSPGVGDGKSITAVNIAGAIALKDKMKTLIVDADMRRHGATTMLGLGDRPGLAEVLRGEAGIEDVVVWAEELPNLHVLPAGQMESSNAAELLESARWKETAAELRKRFQMIVLDTVPIGVVVDAELAQMVSDATIVVVRQDHTDRARCMEALKAVRRDKLLGVVINCSEDWLFWGNQANSYYE
jgi:capsular exopolysaccharide synthesis family protein